MALMVSALCRTTSFSVTVLPMVLEVTRLFGGYFIAPSRVPKYLSWIDALSYIKYAFVGTALNELRGLTLNCSDAKVTYGNVTYYNLTLINGSYVNESHTYLAKTTAPCRSTGQWFIDERDYNYISIGGCIGVLLAFIIFCRFWAFIGVRFLKHQS